MFNEKGCVSELSLRKLPVDGAVIKKKIFFNHFLPKEQNPFFEQTEKVYIFKDLSLHATK